MRGGLLCVVLCCYFTLFSLLVGRAREVADSTRLPTSPDTHNISRNSFNRKKPAHAEHKILLHADYPQLTRQNKLVLDICTQSDSTVAVTLTVQYFKYAGRGDSTNILWAKKLPLKIKRGSRKKRIDFTVFDTSLSYNKTYFEVFKRIGTAPPGQYKLFIDLITEEGISQLSYIHEVDSFLKPTSAVYKTFNTLIPSKAKQIAAIHKKGDPNAGLRTQSKIERAAKKQGLVPVGYKKNDLNVIDLFYDDWFAGRYVVQNNSPNQNIDAPVNFGALTTNDLGHPSLFSQFKTINSSSQENKGLKGELGLATNVSTKQEEYSAVDNNYYELRGWTQTEVSGIPIQIEGLYTSQDRNRKIKSSYFRAHYDVDAMKDRLSKSIKAYNSKFAETRGKAGGLESIYSTGIGNLEGQKARLQSEMQQDKLDLDRTPDLGDGQSPKKKRQAEYEAKIREKREKLAALDEKIGRYKTLLEQNRNTNYFDSARVFSQTGDIDRYRNLSYKEMAKMSGDILPDGKASSFLTGITTVDAGMFNKNSSKYTMNGQMIKGLDFGYDLGFCTATATVGKTQYVSRDGNIDQFTCYSLKSDFKASKTQTFSAMYYGYSPDKKFLAGDDFFKNVSLAAPTFLSPVHIVSLDYAGQLSKYVTVSSEAATSITEHRQNTKGRNWEQSDRMAYNISADGSVPLQLVPIALRGSYDRVGKGFENNTLPVSMTGTEQYKLSAHTDLFKSSLILGIEYNRLVQNSFSVTGKNTRWGFDVRTVSRRYPSLYVSYKPFTTVRSYADTLGIPQRPMLGSVWTGKISYQLKQHARSLRLQLLFNRSTSEFDTSAYGNTLLQSSAVFSDKRFTGSATVGYMYMTTTEVIQTLPNRTTFTSLTSGFQFSKQFSLAGGVDLGFASFGLCRYSNNLVITARPEKLPFGIRLTGRYNTYKLSSSAGWKQIYSGCLDVTYTFKSKNIKSVH